MRVGRLLTSKFKSWNFLLSAWVMDSSQWRLGNYWLCFIVRDSTMYGSIYFFFMLRLNVYRPYVVVVKWVSGLWQGHAGTFSVIVSMYKLSAGLIVLNQIPQLVKPATHVMEFSKRKE